VIDAGSMQEKPVRMVSGSREKKAHQLCRISIEWVGWDFECSKNDCPLLVPLLDGRQSEYLFAGDSDCHAALPDQWILGVPSAHPPTELRWCACFGLF
jgi:hypothetical protein